MLRALLDFNTVVAPALDVDNTLLSLYVPTDRTAYGHPLWDVSPQCLSPKLLQFIADIKQDAKQSRAICEGFSLVTHRMHQTEYINVQLAADKANSWAKVCATYPTIPSDELYLLDESSKCLYLSCHGLNSDDWFAHRVRDNFIQVSGLACYGISTPDDSIESRRFGEAFMLFEPQYRKTEQRKRYYSEQLSSQNVSQFRYRFAQHSAEKTRADIDMSTKNLQLLQYANFLTVKYPNKKIVIPFIDDVTTICDNALRLQLPSNVILVVYQHSALMQSDIKYIGKVQGLHQPIHSSSVISSSLHAVQSFGLLAGSRKKYLVLRAEEDDDTVRLPVLPKQRVAGIDVLHTTTDNTPKTRAESQSGFLPSINRR